jgi:hypothetical protein
MEPTGISQPCPRCGGELEFRHTVESHRTGALVHFFRCEDSAAFIPLNAEHLRWKRRQSASEPDVSPKICCTKK